MSKTAFMIGASVGGIAGAYLPMLFGAGVLSGWSILGSTVGGLAGIFAVAKLRH